MCAHVKHREELGRMWHAGLTDAYFNMYVELMFNDFLGATSFGSLPRVESNVVGDLVDLALPRNIARAFDI